MISTPHPIGPRTELVALIGRPVRHSLSPTIINAAFREMGLDWVFVVFDVPDGGGQAAIRGASSLGLRGLSVTMPHKDAAAASVDQISAAAAALGAVNCISIDRDGTVGHNTDGAGFIDSLEAEVGFAVEGASCMVLGAGGAARAIIRALADAGAADVRVVNRTAEAAQAAIGVAPQVARVASLDDVSDVRLVVNATSLGMHDSTDPGRVHATPIDVSSLGADTVVADIVYHPRRTALLRAADDRGLVAVGGVGMLVHQAALAVQIWTGDEAPVEVMRRAAESALDASS